MKRFHVYILASRKGGTLYTGVTSDIARRIDQHRTGAADGFSKRYSVKRLVYAELCPDAESAIRREKAIKGWLDSREHNIILLSTHFTEFGLAVAQGRAPYKVYWAMILGGDADIGR